MLSLSIFLLELMIMLSKKILSLLLIGGLTVTAPLSTSAWNGESKSDALSGTTEVSKEIMNSATTLLMTRACVIMLLNTIRTINSPEIQNFCVQLEQQKHNPATDISNLKAKFEHLYKTDLSFKKAVDGAWVWDLYTGKKQHASTQCGRGTMENSPSDKIKKTGRGTMENSPSDKIKKSGRSTMDNSPSDK